MLNPHRYFFEGRVSLAKFLQNCSTDMPNKIHRINSTTTADNIACARAYAVLFLRVAVSPGFSRRARCSVQRAARRTVRGFRAWNRLKACAAPRRCNARVTDYLRHRTLPTASLPVYTQAPRRATCSPDRRSIDRI